MNLEELGYNQELAESMIELTPKGFEPGRVVAVHKERYAVRTASGEYEAEVTGNLRFSAASREDFPAVGDWVAVTLCGDDFAVIQKVLPRRSLIKRQAVGQTGETQVIAANVDVAFIVQAADRDFNLNRMERYLAICHSSGVEPVIVLTKTDLADHERLTEIVDGIRKRLSSLPVVPVSNQTMEGMQRLGKWLEKGKTCCLLGSSGVGKSSLMNNLCGEQVMRTGTISQSTHKGRHVTSHRELILLESGGLLIDNPGMREMGIADAVHGLEVTFDNIRTLSIACAFSDCTHTHETGCAVRQAVDRGELDRGSYENWLKLEREQDYFDSTVAARRRKDKDFGKMLKNYKKDRRKNDL